MSSTPPPPAVVNQMPITEFGLIVNGKHATHARANVQIVDVREVHELQMAEIKGVCVGAGLSNTEVDYLWILHLHCFWK